MKKEKSAAKNGHVMPIGPHPVVGILEWFHLNDYKHVELAIEEMKKLGITHLRTGVSWADYHADDGPDWFDWLMPRLSEHFELLPCFLYTPPSKGISYKTSSPPTNPKALADFIDLFVNRHGHHFNYVELWNEPNNISEYDYIQDESWDTFAEMITLASYWARQLGKKTVLGGMSPIDPNWLKMMLQKGALQFIDVIGIHGFPDVFDFHWEGWAKNVEVIREVLKRYEHPGTIWITETGYSTWRYDERRQLEKLLDVLEAPVERVYWYSLTDVPAATATVDGYHSDDREYHFGMIMENGTKKLLSRLWQQGGINNLLYNKWIVESKPQSKPSHVKKVLVTGGAGFIGTNLTHRLLNEGYHVIVMDNLSRQGVERNLSWLRGEHDTRLEIVVADTRDKLTVEKVIGEVSHVFHFAAQVAVTSSLINPVYDFDVNVNGTLNILEAIRKSAHHPSLIFTSTNKVYGNLDDTPMLSDERHYFPEEQGLRENGIDEYRRLDFHSPYGNSKGTADQYILDYARSYNLHNLVFRMSCIYGPHQFGTEDQGWIAHFIRKALHKEPIIFYGDGKQIRDILYVDDLVEAFMLAWKNIDKLQGEAFNIGGGPSNAVSLKEVISILEDIGSITIPLSFDNWRQGDQKYYVSNTSKFNKATGWKPQVSYEYGIKMLYEWLREARLDEPPALRSKILAEINS